MHFSLALKQVLDRHGGFGRGTIKDIEDATGVDRKALSALVNNRVRYVSLDHLGKIADFLVQERGVDPQLLPAILFRRDYGDLWTMLAERSRVELCVGAHRADDGADDRAWVMAADNRLESSLVLHMTTNDATPRGHLQSVLHRHVVQAPRRDGSGREAMERDAKVVYDRFASRQGDRGFVSIGSIKSNPTVELVLARAFGVEPFAPPSTQDARAGRGCPLFMSYRPSDPKVASCWAGAHLPSRTKGRSRRAEPGLYYIGDDGQWAHVPCTDDTDGALIFYAFWPEQARLEVVMGGFTGLATECLASMLPSLGPDAFAPSLRTATVEAGALVIRLHLGQGRRRPAGGGFMELPPFTPRVERVPPGILEQRIA